MTLPLPTFEEWLKSQGYVSTGNYACARCGGVHPTFAFVRVIENGVPSDKFQCSTCHITDVSKAQIAQAEADKLQRVAADPWDCDEGGTIKANRNMLIERNRWAADPVTTPFVEAKRLEFVEYIRLLNRITVDFCCPSDIQWPTAPSYGPEDYA